MNTDHHIKAFERECMKWRKYPLLRLLVSASGDLPVPV